VLGPLLGLWLPHLMCYLGFSILLQVTSGNEVADGSRWQSVAIAASYVIPLCAASFGLFREMRVLAARDHETMARSMTMPERQGALLAAQLTQIWDTLTGGRTEPPRLICQPSFGVLAHAYDNEDGQTIEVSAGLAGRAVHADPLALSILRHEVAHLVHGDLPAVRRHSAVAGAAIVSIDVALAICVVTALAVIIMTDLRQFPFPATAGNIVAVHLAITLAAVIVTIPLVLGRFVLRRYAGFIVALVEMRADVSAGIWGDGLQAFSGRLERDPSIRATTVRDVGLAISRRSLVICRRRRGPPCCRILADSPPRNWGTSRPRLP